MNYNVFQYLNLKPQEKTDYFMQTRSKLSFLPNYWVNFDNVKRNLDKYDIPDLYTLDYLIGKNRYEIENFFKERAHLIKLVPKLLGIRENKMSKGNLEVQGIDGTYHLNFRDIDTKNIEHYIKFIHESGLTRCLQKGLRKSVHDYAVGVEAGMDSNGRKNRSGDMGEMYLEKVLNAIADERNWIAHGQTTAKLVKKWHDIDLEDTFANRRFDGSLFNPQREKLYLFEVNNFNSGGSKSKASATEFKDLHDRFSRTNHEFIYITDGKGWDSDKSHLIEAMEYIGKVFNYQMVEDGYLKDFLI